MPLRRTMSLSVLTGLVIGLVGTGVTSASALVTDGSTVTSPSRSVPWAVSLFYAKAAGQHPQFICTASAIGPRELLTAAHCVQAGGFYFVKVGADVLTGGRLVPVEAVNDNAKYSSRLLVNDVAVLRPLQPMGLSSYARLGAPAMARSRKLSELRLAGCEDLPLGHPSDLPDRISWA